MTRLIDADSIPWLVEGVGEIPVITKEEIDQMPTVVAVPISFIEKRIEQLKNQADYEFEENGGYAGGSQYRQWELECLLDAWAKRKDNG